jgi:hypothetical protein
MARDKIYVPVDPADVFLVPPAPRDPPVFIVERARHGRRLALILACASVVGALGGAWLSGATAAVTFFACAVAAGFGFLQWRGARWLLRVVRDGQPIAAKVCIDLGHGPTEVKYANEERDVSGNLAVFAGDPTSANMSMDYEYAGRIWSVATRVVGEGKPAAVRLQLGGKVGCAVLVHAADPGRPLLVTQKMAKAVLSARA